MRAIPALLRLLTDDLTNEQLGEALLLTSQSFVIISIQNQLLQALHVAPGQNYRKK